MVCWLLNEQGAQECVRCVDPCERDPCNGFSDRKNLCRSGPAVSGRRLLQAGSKIADKDCYPYECSCGGYGWTESLDLST